MTIKGWWNRSRRKRGHAARPFYGVVDKNLYYTGLDATDYRLFQAFGRINFRHGIAMGRRDPYYGFTEVREWLHHNTGYRIEESDPMFGEYYIQFRDPNDAFAMRMRFKEAEVSRLSDQSLIIAEDREWLARYGVAEFSD